MRLPCISISMMQHHNINTYESHVVGTVEGLLLLVFHSKTCNIQ